MDNVEQPWRGWMPGVLGPEQLEVLCHGGFILEPPPDFGLSAFDLQVGSEGWLLPEGTVKPNGTSYLGGLRQRRLVEELRLDSDGAFALERRKSYLLRLKQRIAHGVKLADAGIHGQATARSTIGRLDVLARFILDGMRGYENFGSEELRDTSGDMFIEVTPMSFPVRVKPGGKLSQLRLFYGKPEDSELRGKLYWQAVTAGSGSVDGDRTLSVSLESVQIGPARAVAFRASEAHQDSPIDTWLKGTYDPLAYWEIIPPRGDVKDKRIRLDVGRFYILRSQERLRLPADVAAYCRATDETIGEMRIHYAGFVHPHFGAAHADGDPGTPLIFEVRGHDFASNLRHGETMARLQLYRMSCAARQPTTDDNTYEEQELKLSAVFAEWPKAQGTEPKG